MWIFGQMENKRKVHIKYNNTNPLPLPQVYSSDSGTHQIP